MSVTLHQMNSVMLCFLIQHGAKRLQQMNCSTPKPLSVGSQRLLQLHGSPAHCEHMQGSFSIVYNYKRAISIYIGGIVWHTNIIKITTGGVEAEV